MYLKFLPESLAYFQQVIEGFKNQGCEAVALSCTEIPLLGQRFQFARCRRSTRPGCWPERRCARPWDEDSGIIGGIGPESTIDYYRLIVAAYREQRPDGSYPAIIINSIDLNKIRDLVTANALADLTEYLVAEVQRLARAGADFGLLAANTPHIVFDDIRQQSPIPLLSIVEATCDAAQSARAEETRTTRNKIHHAGPLLP